MNKIVCARYLAALPALLLCLASPLLAEQKSTHHWSYEGESGPEHWGELSPDFFPPCTEGVRWIVLKTPIQASAEQIETFKKRVGPVTNRPVQPLNARIILD